MLRLDVFKTEITKLCSFYTKTLSDAQLEQLFEIFKHVSSDAFAAAVRGCIANERYWPTPNVLMNHVEAFRPAHKCNTTPRQLARTSNRNSPYVQEAKKLFMLIAENRDTRKYTDFELGELCSEMDVKYKGFGWDKLARQMISRFYLSQNQPVPQEFRVEQSRGSGKTCPPHLLCHVEGCRKVGAWCPSVNAEKGPWFCTEHSR